MTARAGAGARGPSPREICIVMLSAIGDAVHVLPVATAIKRAWPESRITWIVQPGPRVLAENHPAIDEFIVFHRHRGARGWMGFAELSRQVQGRHFDLVLGLQVYLKAGLITALLSADTKLGFDRGRARDLNWLFTNERIAEHPGQHVQDQYFEFVRHLGIDPEPVCWDLKLSPEEREAQEEFFAPLDRPVCAVVVGTSKPKKNWDAVRYARVLEMIEKQHGLQPVLVGGPSVIEGEMAALIVEETRARPINALGNDLRRLIYILQGSCLLISPDTGPLHIGVALDVPTVGLYGHTNPKRHGPYRRFGDLVVDGYALHPGEDYPLNMEYRDGMHRVTVDAVLGKVELALSRYGPSAEDHAT